MSKKLFEKIKRALKAAKKILLVTHIEPDGDTIGSMLALYFILKKWGKKPVMFSPDAVPDIYRFLPGTGQIRYRVDAASFDCIVTLDAGSPKRLGPISKGINFQRIINIDHHPDNSVYGAINYIANVSSVAEQVYTLAKYLKVPLDKNIAVCLYVAMMTDTGNFKYENTTAQTFAIARDLLEAGVSPHQTANAVYENRTPGSMRILAAVLQRARIICGGKLIYAVITRAMLKRSGARDQDLTGVIDHLRSIRGVKVAVLIREEEKRGRVKINFRSKGQINVQKIAKKLGGGGHKRAAGAIISGGLRSLIKKVVTLTCSSLC